MYRIFIVEDDEGIASAVKKHLDSWGYDVRCAEDFSNVISEINSFEPHIVLMDISLPFYNGFYWCGEIRKNSKIPVVFLSSQSDNMNIITAMNMGGDDFIAKPFDLTVLMAKLQAILRRTYDFGTIEAPLSHNGAVLNSDDATVIYNGEKIDLTKNEYRILQLLMEKKGSIVSRELLMEKLWETDCFVDENTLTVNVTRLRKKLEKYGLTDFIKTKVGMGYFIGE
ncbi:MAG: response regulator transcription factor [Oscillospiraceae bacterium]|nr:response regulator transcription factor [Oscillospiraceae bacterium]